MQRAEREGWERRENSGRVEYAPPPLNPQSQPRPKTYRKRKPSTKLGGRLREVRTLLNKNIVQMAKTMEVSPASWGKYESGEVVPGANILELLAAAGIDPRWLLVGEGSPTAQEKDIPEDTQGLLLEITTYDELSHLARKAFSDKALHKIEDYPLHSGNRDLLLDAYVAATTAIGDYCLYTGTDLEKAKLDIIHVHLVREYLRGRNPYDHKRIAPEIVKSLFALARQDAPVVQAPLCLNS